MSRQKHHLTRITYPRLLVIERGAQEIIAQPKAPFNARSTYLRLLIIERGAQEIIEQF